MAIPLATKWAIAEGKETDFARRVLVQLHRHAIYRIGQGATGQELTACRAIWASVSQYQFALTLATLNEQFVGVADVPALLATPDTGAASVEAAVAAQWPMFLTVYFPTV